MFQVVHSLHASGNALKASPRGLLQPTPLPQVSVGNGIKNLQQEIDDEFTRWTSDPLPKLVSERLLQSVARGQGGILMVHAPSKELETLRWDSTDKGYMSERVQENNVWNVMHEPR